MTTIRLPYVSPPLRSNDRLNHFAKARAVKAVREVGRWAGNQVIRDNLGPFPIDHPVIVTLVWEVTDNRTRDVGASTPTLKAAIDGLVDAGVLLHDRHSIVTEERYRIEVGQCRSVRLEIVAVDGDQDADSRPGKAPRSDQRLRNVEPDTDAATALSGHQEAQ